MAGQRDEHEGDKNSAGEGVIRNWCTKFHQLKPLTAQEACRAGFSFELPPRPLGGLTTQFRAHTHSLGRGTPELLSSVPTNGTFLLLMPTAGAGDLLDTLTQGF